MSDTYTSDICPHCDKINYYCLGDPEDPSGIDIEALICWDCEYKWLLPMCEEWTNKEDAYTEKGLKKIK